MEQQNSTEKPINWARRGYYLALVALLFQVWKWIFPTTEDARVAIRTLSAGVVSFVTALTTAASPVATTVDPTAPIRYQTTATNSVPLPYHLVALLDPVPLHIGAHLTVRRDDAANGTHVNAFTCSSTWQVYYCPSSR